MRGASLRQVVRPQGEEASLPEMQVPKVQVLPFKAAATPASAPTAAAARGLIAPTAARALATAALIIAAAAARATADLCATMRHAPG